MRQRCSGIFRGTGSIPITCWIPKLGQERSTSEEVGLELTSTDEAEPNAYMHARRRHREPGARDWRAVESGEHARTACSQRSSWPPPPCVVRGLPPPAPFCTAPLRTPAPSPSALSLPS
eukprot:6190893-Pleurochrysis_carterae.AAC.2